MKSEQQQLAISKMASSLSAYPFAGGASMFDQLKGV